MHRTGAIDLWQKQTKHWRPQTSTAIQGVPHGRLGVPGPNGGRAIPIDWDEPTARFRLAEQVGLHRYAQLEAAYMRRTMVATIGGHAIREKTSSRFGRLFIVGGTGRAFRRLDQAKAYARKEANRLRDTAFRVPACDK